MGRDLKAVRRKTGVTRRETGVIDAVTGRQIMALVRQARRAAGKAYAPYSQFHVGAAILTRSGKVVTGCNVENASYGLTICAERNAVAMAVASGYRTFRAVAVVAGNRASVPPCGACLQVLAEFGGPDLEIVLSGTSPRSPVVWYRLADLLPLCFKMQVL